MNELKKGENCFYLGQSEAEAIAKIEWIKSADQTLVATHTYTDPSLRGQGIAGQLFEAFIEEARRTGCQVVGECSYVANKLASDPQKYVDVIK